MSTTPDRENEKKALDMLRHERDEQRGFGFDEQHDDQHDHGEIADAAAAYLLAGQGRAANGLWPWDLSDFRPDPGYRIRELAKAGGLIVAEIERLLRLEASEHEKVLRFQIVPDEGGFRWRLVLGPRSDRLVTDEHVLITSTSCFTNQAAAGIAARKLREEVTNAEMPKPPGVS